ncbi:hypothetical protein PCASD_23599 [Puccinia coronata f. sp. avenae]|uniref:Uncharacterized protein n=1 Tax=Puccinia coronata f. sp. avenae TaxID=200324 RepID=A0A2N5S8A0_9BASI|nr:hypothetical protein PCASD_23599 [Puccinia coronata f. sp. avenae]
MVENTHLYKELVEVMKSPTETDEYQLQLLKPWHYLQDNEDISKSMKDFPYEKLGINEGEHNLELLMQQGNIAKVNLSRQLVLMTETSEQINYIRENLTPEDIKSITKYYTEHGEEA